MTYIKWRRKPPSKILIKRHSSQNNQFLSINLHSNMKHENVILFPTYLIDPNKFRFKFVVRILANVLKYVKIFRHLVHTRRNPNTKTTNNDVQQNEAYHLTDDEIEEAEIYCWKKGTGEVKRFVNPQRNSQISTEVNGILIYSGRILPTDKINITTPMTKIMKDLHDTTFCVHCSCEIFPTGLRHRQRNSLVQYKSVKHSGIEATMRVLRCGKAS